MKDYRIKEIALSLGCAYLAAIFSLAANDELITKTALRLSKQKNPYQSVYDEGMSSKLDYYTDRQIEGMGKYDRFQQCQHGVVIFSILAREAKTFEPVTTKEEWLESHVTSYGLDYPFSSEDSAYGPSRISQMQFSLAYQYRGKGEQGAPIFWRQCLAIPLNIFTIDYQNATEEELAQWEEEDRKEAIKRDKENENDGF